MTPTYELLSRRFKPWEYEHNAKGHLYVTVQATTARLNELDAWYFIHNDTQFQVSPNETQGGRTQYLAVVSGTLSIPSLGERFGVGADENFDLDNAVKSAEAYALRKAANWFGVAFEILGNSEPAQEARADIEQLIVAWQGNRKALKAQVAKLAGTTDVQEIGERFGLLVGDDLNDVDILTSILKKEGVF